jgi:hypothetical protein
MNILIHIIINEIKDTITYFKNKYSTNENYKQNELLFEWKESRYIVLSSLFFLFPAIYAYNYKLYMHMVVLILTSLLSANYWRNATYGLRRKLDHCFAKFAFSYFVILGIINVKYLYEYLLIFISVYLYYLSCKNSELSYNNKKNKIIVNQKHCWYHYHMLFHFTMTTAQFIILHNIVTN